MAVCTRAGASGGRVHTCRCSWWPYAHVNLLLEAVCTRAGVLGAGDGTQALMLVAGDYDTVFGSVPV